MLSNLIDDKLLSQEIVVLVGYIYDRLRCDRAFKKALKGTYSNLCNLDKMRLDAPSRIFANNAFGADCFNLFFSTIDFPSVIDFSSILRVSCFCDRH